MDDLWVVLPHLGAGDLPVGELESGVEALELLEYLRILLGHLDLDGDEALESLDRLLVHGLGLHGHLLGASGGLGVPVPRARLEALRLGSSTSLKGLSQYGGQELVSLETSSARSLFR